MLQICFFEFFMPIKTVQSLYRTIGLKFEKLVQKILRSPGIERFFRKIHLLSFGGQKQGK